MQNKQSQCLGGMKQLHLRRYGVVFRTLTWLDRRYTAHHLCRIKEWQIANADTRKVHHEAIMIQRNIKFDLPKFSVVHAAAVKFASFFPSLDTPHHMTK